MTTSFGLLPMLLETSLQAQFLIPVAISLAFGLLFGTAVILVLVPVLVMIESDLDWRAPR
jgi:multidrug efflux pump subunit AcrB